LLRFFWRSFKLATSLIFFIQKIKNWGLKRKNIFIKLINLDNLKVWFLKDKRKIKNFIEDKKKFVKLYALLVIV